MTNSTHTKTLVAAVVAGALAFAAPAVAMVQDPIIGGYQPASASEPASGPAYQVDAAELAALHGTSEPASGPAYQVDAAELAALHGTSPDATPTDFAPANFAAFHTDTAPAGVEQATAASGDGFDWGSAAIGAGAALLVACLAMMGSAAVGGRRSASKLGQTVSQGA